MSIIASILLVLGAILGFLFSNKSTKKVNDQNNKVLNEVDKLQTQVNTNNTAIQKEEDTRKTLEKDLQNEKDKPSSIDNDADFFNKR